MIVPYILSAASEEGYNKLFMAKLIRNLFLFFSNETLYAYLAINSIPILKKFN